MGKKDNARAEEMRLEKEQAAKARREAERRQNLKWIIPVVIALVVIVAVTVVAVVLSKEPAVSDKTKTLRGVTVAESEHFAVDGAMMKYWIYDYANSILDTDENPGVKEGSPIETQTVGGKNALVVLGEQLMPEIENYLAGAECALKEGISVSDQVRGAMHTKASQFTYIPEGVTEDDIVKCLEISYLFDQCSEKYASAAFTDEEIEAFAKGNEKSILSCDLVWVRFSYDKNNVDSIKKAKDIAESCVIEGDFDTVYQNLLNTIMTVNDSDIEAAESLACINYGVSYSDTEMAKWAFADGRKDGDVTVIDNVSENSYAICLIKRAPYRCEDDTYELYRVEFAAEIYGNASAAYKQAEQILEAFEKDGVSREEFETLAKGYNFTGLSRNGYSENTRPASMPKDVAAWCADPVRKEGDYALIKTENGAELVYYVAKGHPVWYASALESLRANGFVGVVTDYLESDKIKMHPDRLGKIAG